MPTAAEWDMHARQTRSIADCAARFGDAATARFLRASVDEMERLAAIAAATDAGTKIRVNVTVLPVRGRHNHAHMRLDPAVTYPESPRQGELQRDGKEAGRPMLALHGRPAPCGN